jgi:riboflavin synthase
MFTGIIEQLGTLSDIEDLGGGKSFTIQAELSQYLSVDDSICVNGVCLTVIHCTQTHFRVQAVEETLRKTTLSHWMVGIVVNLERGMIMGGRFDGHWVQGHVDTTGTLVAITPEQTGIRLDFSYPPSFADHLVDRGSIAIDGISLTIAEAGTTTFSVAIIPYTWEHTQLKQLQPGSPVNLEFDMIGKYILRFLNQRSH